MATAHDMDLHQFLTDRLTDTSPDLLRNLLSTFIDALMGAETDTLCGAGFGERSSGAHQQSERLPTPRFRSPKHFVGRYPHPRRDTRRRDPEVPVGFVLSGLATVAPQACRERVDLGRCTLLSARCFHRRMRQCRS